MIERRALFTLFRDLLFGPFVDRPFREPRGKQFFAIIEYSRYFLI